MRYHFLYLCSFVGNTEIDVEIKKYYCRAGITSIQVKITHFPKVPLFVRDLKYTWLEVREQKGLLRRLGLIQLLVIC